MTLTIRNEIVHPLNTDDTVRTIFDFLDERSLRVCSIVNHHWARIGRDDRLWKTLLYEELPSDEGSLLQACLFLPFYSSFFF
jgi:hypothetical protein